MKISSFLSFANQHVKPFLLGALLVWVIGLLVLGFANERLYRAIVQNYIAQHGEQSEQEFAVGLLNLTHELVSTRIDSLGGWQGPSLRTSLIQPANLDLLIGDGICGSYVGVFTRIAQAAGLSVRIGQMRCGATQGCHMFSEVLLNGRWVVMDAMYNVAFRNDDGTMAVFEQVSANFGDYKSQLPSDYQFWFDYTGVQRTNWNKIPVVMPALRRALLWVVPAEAVDGFSARVYLLNWYFNQLYLTGILILAWLAVQRFWLFFRRRFSVEQCAKPDSTGRSSEWVG